jgi:hypothetical protein
VICYILVSLKLSNREGVLNREIRVAQIVETGMDERR